MKARLGLILLLGACSSDKGLIGDGKDDLDSGTGGLGGTSGASSGGTGALGGSSGSDAGTCPPLVVDSMPNCTPKYAGSFECYCEQGEMYHPIGCDTTKDELFAQEPKATLVEYASCGLFVIYRPASLDGDQQYVFDAAGTLVGARMTSDHGPVCLAGTEVGAECVVTDCTQKTADSPPCPL